ncbi:S8 family serine peptidase [Streptomyces sp. P01-B04]|uniref:S8 family serine peptidase n=1 Tax=Streptomyces poriferorum TaxID=2798799 RepID=UPI001C5D372B|nr:S8 family serine peptidase [Streptomyces poriferorum]MBW5250230.1 S8 family serine peptidase [Streptomyces poriferorum]MBW5259794.1 S8 family serine peptidase [Streptomyces poriferorum]
MRRSKPWQRTTAGIAAVVLLGVGGHVAIADEAADGVVPVIADQAGPDRSVTLTLITGDVVDARVDTRGRVLSAAPRPADGTDHTAAVWQDGEHTYVFPQGVEKLIDAGTVDAALFDIGRLVADGYDDASTDALPVIVAYEGGRTPRSAASGTRTTAQLDSIGGAGLAVAKASAADAWKDLAPRDARTKSVGAIRKIWLDARVHGTAAPSLGTPTVPLTGATTAHTKGLDGSGVKVAVLDTGVDAAHPDLAGRIAATKVFVNSQDGEDRTGHGTHTASTVAGTGAASQGRYAGMAPKADLLIGKVLGDDGSGSLSGIVDGMEWAVAHGADVVSMSLGADGATSCSGPDVEAVQRLGGKALFVIAAGNASLHGTVSTPGCAPSALTVGAVDRDNRTAPFSSRGPSVDGMSAKPDIASQGVDVVAARSGGQGENAYQEMSGTSMATPHVAGGAALLVQQQPELTPAQLKALLTASAARTDAPVLDQGSGPLDVARAITQPVIAEPASLLGDFAYPQAGLDPVEKPVTLTNITDKPVTLALTVQDVRGDDGSRLSRFATPGRRTVTVPANGTVDVPVRIDPSAHLDAADYGTVTGRLVGIGAHGTRVTVPFGVHMEVPSADLTVKGLDRHGDPAQSPATFQVFDDQRDTARRYTLGYPDPGSTTIRVPLGTYALGGVIMTRDAVDNVGSVESVSQLYNPEVKVTGDTVVTLDARDARRVSWETDRPSQSAGYAIGTAFGLDDAKKLNAGYLAAVPSYVKGVYAQPVSHDERLTFLASARRVAPLAKLTAADGRVLDSLPLQKGTEFDGQGSAEIVAVGKGTEANFAAHDLKGKIALVDAGVAGGNGFDWARFAATAGAVGVLSAYPDTEGRFQLSGTDGVPQASITWADSLALKELADQGKAVVRWSGTATAKSPYLYNLAHVSHGSIRPGTQRVHDSDLAVRDARYHVQNSSDTTYWSDVQVGLPGVPAIWAGGTTLALQAPQNRTEFFTPTGSEGLSWTTLMRRNLGMYEGTAYDGPHAVGKGRTTANWYKSPYGPVRNTYARKMMTRDSNRLSYVMAPFGDAGGHDSTLTMGDYGTRQLLVNGEPQTPSSGMFTLPQEKAEVTFRQAWRRAPSAANRTGLAYGTEWTFSTDASDQGAQRLLVPVIDVPSDLRNTRPAGATTTIGINAVVDGSEGPVALDSATLEYAYGDESTVEAVSDWHTAKLAPAHGTWEATLPADAPAGSFVHLRVTLADDQGSRVTQTVVRAYEVR